MAAATSTTSTATHLSSAYGDLGSPVASSAMAAGGSNNSAQYADRHPDSMQNQNELQAPESMYPTQLKAEGETLTSHDAIYQQTEQDLPTFPTPVSFIGGTRTSLFAPSRQRQTHSGGQTLYGNRPRGKSITEVVAEKAMENLSAPVSITLVALCLSWYGSSAISNTLNKSILNIFPYPVTLSLVQFFLAVCFGVSTILLAQNSHKVFHALPAGTVSHSGLRYPTREILASTIPMGIFQLFGHICSHKATSLIPVSLVHTIKALSPLFTVAAYRLVFKVQYSAKTYFSLIPLTTGVVMTCSTQFSSQMQGIVFALSAALIFVSQNIYSKKLLTHRPASTSGVPEDTGSQTPRIDKLNILCYCSSLAFVFTFPLWFFSEGMALGHDYLNQEGKFFTPDITTSSDAVTQTAFSTSYLLFCFLLNGLSHFLQNLLAFQVLGMVSPVTYSVASLVKRIVVVTFSIVWFGQRVNALQGWGIMLTFFGLYLYDKLGGDGNKQRKYANITLQPQQSLPK